MCYNTEPQLVNVLIIIIFSIYLLLFPVNRVQYKVYQSNGGINMKRFLAILLSMAMLLILGACSGEQTSEEQKDDGGKYDLAEVPDQSPWEAVFTDYQNRSFADSKIFAAADVTEEDIKLFKTASSDLPLTSTYFKENTGTQVKVSFAYMLTKASLQYIEDGNIGRVEGKRGDVTTVYELNFPGENAAEFKIYDDDVVRYTLTICVTEDYWARAYTSPETEVFAVGYKNGDIYVGSKASDGNPSVSLLENPDAPAEPSFVTSLDTYVAIVGGAVERK